MITWYGSLDGSIGKISPIGEKMYKRLQLLQTLMQTHMPHYAGLNPKEYRSVSNLVFAKYSLSHRLANAQKRTMNFQISR